MFSKAFRTTLLRRNVKEAGDGVACSKVLKEPLSLGIRGVSIDGTGFDIRCFQSIDLVRLEDSAWALRK